MSKDQVDQSYNKTSEPSIHKPVSHITDLGHFDPLLNDAGPDQGSGGGPTGPRAKGTPGDTQQGADDPVSDSVELGNGGPDGGGHVVLFVTLGPDATQALVRHHPGEERLVEETEEHSSITTSDPPTQCLHSGRLADALYKTNQPISTSKSQCTCFFCSLIIIIIQF